MPETPKQRAARLAERARVDAHASSFSRPGKPRPQSTAKQIRDKKSEELRKRGTPSGLQGLVDVMTQKKKKKER